MIMTIEGSDPMISTGAPELGPDLDPGPGGHIQGHHGPQGRGVYLHHAGVDHTIERAVWKERLMT